MFPYDILYSCILKEHQLDDDFEFVAAMAEVILFSSFLEILLYDSVWIGTVIHVRKLHQERIFKKMYRMSPSSFNWLLTMILPWLKVNKKTISKCFKRLLLQR